MIKLVKFSAIQHSTLFIVCVNPDAVASIYDMEDNHTGIYLGNDESYEVIEPIEIVYRAITGEEYDGDPEGYKRT